MISSFDSILNNSASTWLFPELREELGFLTHKQQLFVSVIEIMDVEKFTLPLNQTYMGRPVTSRTPLFKSFILKAVYNLPTTKVLIEYILSAPTLRRLCGWERQNTIPSEATFSRAFKEFSDLDIGQSIHHVMTSDMLNGELPQHASIDGTSIRGREKPCRKNRPNKTKKKKKEPKRVELQGDRSLTENIEDLPNKANWGAKKDSKGNKMKWCGYKLHLDCIDGDIPVASILTSASVHDSQVAIPLMQMTQSRTNYLYDLMDAAYDSPAIHEFSRNTNHIPIIDPNKRKKDYAELAPARKRRYNERSTAERVNADLKDNHGGRTVRVKGPDKVMAHLMFGILVITAKQMISLVS